MPDTADTDQDGLASSAIVGVTVTRLDGRRVDRLRVRRQAPQQQAPVGSPGSVSASGQPAASDETAR